MKFTIHATVHALTQAWFASFADRPNTDQHYDPVAPVPRGPLLSILISAY